MITLEDLLKLNDAEKEFRELYIKYPEIHQDPPKTVDQLIENEKKYPDYKQIFDRFFKDCPRVGAYLSEKLFDPKDDVALLMHTRFVPGFMHYHEFFEITHVMNGKYRCYINDTFLELEKGDVCILAPHVYHCPITHMEEDVVCNVLVRSSTFEKSFFHIMKHNPILLTFFSRSLNESIGGGYLKFSNEDDKEVEYILLTMLNEFRNRGLYYAPIVNKLMSALFVLLLRNHSNTLVTGFSDHLNFSQKITSVLQHIRENVQSLTLPELAKKFSYSERQVSRLLVKYTGKSFTTILQDTRMQQACMLLKESNRTINEIIFQCGYKNQNHFYTIFKRYYGKTPAQYRRDILLEKSLKDDGMDFDELI